MMGNLSKIAGAVVITGCLAAWAFAYHGPAQYPSECERLNESCLSSLIAYDLNAGVPGVSVFITAGEQSVTIAKGLANIKDATPLDTNTPLRLASITKPITYAIISQMIDENKFSRDAPVSQLLPAQNLKGLPNVDTITVAHLLDHVSGLESFTDQAAFEIASWREATNRRVTLSPEQLLGFVRNMPARFPPGEQFHYSNTNYILLGLIVEEIDNRPLKDVYQTRVFQPLGMSNSFLEDGSTNIHPIASSYSSDSFSAARRWGAIHDGQTRYTTHQLVDMSADFPAGYNAWAWAAGAVASTPTDLAKFLAAVARQDLTALPPNLHRRVFEEKKGVDWNGGSWGIAASSYFDPTHQIRIVILFNGVVDGWDRMRTFNRLIDLAELNVKN